VKNHEMHTNGRNDGGLLSPNLSVKNHEMHTNARNYEMGAYYRVPKFDFPKFDGGNPRMWLRKYQRYFLFNLMPDYEKIMLAAMNMEGVADHWYGDYIEGKENMMWERFAELLLCRFQNSDGGNLIGKFNKLKQQNLVADYIQEFEEMKSFIGDEQIII